MALRANELRIGNLAVIEGNEVIVDGRVICDIWTGEITDVEPIFITSERLLEFGFEKNDIGYDIKIDGGLFLELLFTNNNDWIPQYIMEIEGKREFLVLPEWMKHVHQLQNLYFALAGEELTIKQLGETYDKV